MITTLSLTSCSKEDIELTNESQNTEAAFTLEQVPETNIISFDLPARGRSQGGNATMLSFASIEDFVAAAEELEAAIEAHEDNFVAQYDHLTDDELDDMEDNNEFNSKQPLLDFEQSRNFANSLRSTYDIQVRQWLDNETLDMEVHPSNDLLFNDEEMALLNSDQEVMIDGKVFSFGKPLNNYEIIGDFGISLQKINNGEDVSNDPYIITTPKSASSCSGWKAASDQINISSNRKIFRKVEIRSLPWYTRTQARQVSYKKRGRRWRKSRTRLGVNLTYALKGSACFGPNAKQGFGAKSRKRRRTRQKTITIWGSRTLKARNGQSVFGDFHHNGSNSSKALTW